MDDPKTAQTDVDVIVVVAETPAVEGRAPKLTFGPDGAINDPALLSILQHEKPLGPIDLLKLADFFGKFPTNIFLMEILRVSAFSTMLAHPQLKKIVDATFRIDIDEVRDNEEDKPFNEGWLPWDHTADDNKEDSGDHGIIFVKTDLTPSTHPAHSNEAGLLIQSQVVNAEKTLYFVIGVSPSPASLPLAGLKSRKPRKIHPTHTDS